MVDKKKKCFAFEIIFFAAESGCLKNCDTILIFLIVKMGVPIFNGHSAVFVELFAKFFFPYR